MSYINIQADVSISIDEILSELSSQEKQDLVDDLYEDGYKPSAMDKSIKSTNMDFDEACYKLVGESWRLTREEEDFIISISKRF